MNPNVPDIAQLKELGLPAPVSYAPQTWGWWALLALLLAAAALIGFRRYRQWQRNRYRREALLRLAQLRSRSDDLRALRELPELLKRVALSMPVPARKTHLAGAGLPGKRTVHSASVLSERTPSRASPLPQGPAALGDREWQRFLEQHCASPLPPDFSHRLGQLAYAPDTVLQALPEAQRQTLFDLCQTWVERHHVAA
ncbi:MULTISPECIES: DUF4381 domain-containing protein [unclassified Pseudomonas]|uniref:DUF4381 domain-containing protein n=1 Tax=unclassified Pseudomonas TaxID=196821 RepID=UPI000A1FF2F3|nr:MULTISPECIES: DUF4381 domain-containing protein [unclassified Pseudomonas]